MRLRPHLLAPLLCALLAGGPALAAQPPRFEASVNSDTVGIDDVLRLDVMLERDATQAYQGYQRPDPKDFEIISQSESESTQWTFMNGVQSTRTTEKHVYLLRPRHKGASTIPSAVARVDGKELKTPAIVVRVGAASKNPSASAGASPAPGHPGLFPPMFPGFEPPSGMRGDEDVFVEARVDRPTVHVGEQVIVSWTLFTRADILRYRNVTEPKHDDFWSEDLYVPPGRLSWERQIVKGQPYQAALLLRKALYPLRAGKLTVSALEAEATTLQTAFYAGGSAVRASKPLTVEVLPLPAEGRLEGFESTNVGRYELTASLDRSRVKAGEAVTYRVAVRGHGNLRNLKLPKIDRLDGFKVYEPSVADDLQRSDTGIEGMRTFSYLLLPRKGGELTIPSLGLVYFDPDEKRYQRTVAPALTVTVEGDPEKIGSGGKEALKENVLGPRIRALRVRSHISSRIGEQVLRGPLLWVGLGVPPSALFLIVVGAALRERLQRETARSKRRRARAAARRRMRACELHIKAQRPSAFFGECARSLYEHLEYRLGMKCESYTMEELRRLLGDRGFDTELSAAIASELENCDFARFALSASGPGEMRAAIRRVRQLLGLIEQVRLPDDAMEAAA